MKPTTRMTDAGPKRCLNGIFEIPESFSTGSTSACALESYHAPPVSHSRANPARSEAGRGRRIAGPEEVANWLPAPESGPFSMKLQRSWLRPQVLDGTWTPPPVGKYRTAPSVRSSRPIGPRMRDRWAANHILRMILSVSSYGCMLVVVFLTLGS